MRLSTFSWLAYTTTIYALPTSNSSTIQWKACEGLSKNESSLFQCATLDVPLDYQRGSGGNNTLLLNLLKYPASKQPSKGSVLFNPGGPGSSGRTDLVVGQGALASLISAYAGFDYDIVTWDPRGTGTTIPAVCFESAASRALVLDRVPYISDANFDTTAPTAFGVGGSVAAACKAALKDTGELLGSSYVARDMVQILDALGGDGQLRYYGASYGTALGMIFAAMFPERVERMVLDGVLNPRQYMAGLDYQQIASIDAVFDGFLAGCLSRSSECSLTNLNITTTNLKQHFVEAMDFLDKNPFSYGPGPTDFVTSSTVSQQVILGLYDPSGWKALATYLEAVITRNATALAAIVAATPPTPPPPFNDQSTTETIPAIRCSDVDLRAKDVSEVLPIAKTILDQSPLLASYVISSQPLLCSQWPFRAKERYTGNFEVQTKNPILFVGNVFDPITSLDGARNASATFKGSRLLVHQGYGHTSEKQLSKCTIDATAAYFNTGKLPAEGTVCLPEVPIFATQEEQAVVAKALLVPQN